MPTKTKFSIVPKHIAYIIDGNGRWAKSLGKPRSFGHLKGIERLKKVIEKTFEYGVKIISVYCFSTENWDRPDEEIQYLFKLFKDFAKTEAEKLHRNNIRVCCMGDYRKFPQTVIVALEELLEKTKNNTGNILNLGLNYGGRPEIIRAINKVLEKNKGEITERDIEKNLYTCGLPDPDFIVRTSGEKRLSNFMLWQSAYSELYFPKVYWPGFTSKWVEKALTEFQKRDRRFGTIQKEKR